MLDDLLGVPYKLHGRSLEGMDCYGFVLEIYRRLGRKISDAFSCKEVFISNFIEVDVPQMWDILLFKDSKGNVCHMGVYLKNDDFIHCDIQGVHIEKLASYFRRYEVYRWQQ